MLRVFPRFNRNLISMVRAKPATSLLRTFHSSIPARNAEGKIENLVEEISKLSLLETSKLVEQLKQKLNISDIAPMAAPMAVPGAAAGAAEEANDEPKPEEKTTWNLKLESFDAGSKAKVIKEVKSLLGLSLVDAKKFVESAPKVLKENVLKEDAEAIKSKLEQLTCKVTLE
ncbi:ribosomal protein subunit L12 [Schizosaccharomyces octosporus yFS286]|uniref:Ribosomal protein subunit L12 n=1 Tax=Schizosaccharomyces octosporus (strain yFS286) TaxID=483514 RepID=S9PNV7_SCHOY|nr:ribosomal protein subunit L12 [Schizosaccharomyces octosporus yFS286]EPX70936.1 ribosomal protein subunit L12 [Schizosaccharomyces octosporus yFS286]